MNNDLSAGQFQAMTGLTAKALRLYAERGIVTPAAVDQSSGYRLYNRTQLRHGATVDLLRRAQVPLTELATAADFSFDEWRQTVTFRRQMEDFYLDVAEQVATFESGNFTALSSSAPALDWLGVIIDLDLPEDVDEKIGRFASLAVDTPAVEKAYGQALEHLGIGPAKQSWTGIPNTPPKNKGAQMLLARTGPPLDKESQEFIVARVKSATAVTVEVASGRLPRRLEITFDTGSSTELTAVQEAELGYLQMLAFEDHIERHNLTAIGARQVVSGDTVFPIDAQVRPVSVFDVAMPGG